MNHKDEGCILGMADQKLEGIKATYTLKTQRALCLLQRGERNYGGKKDVYLVQTFVIWGELSLTDELVLINLTYDANHLFTHSFNNYLLNI